MKKNVMSIITIILIQFLLVSCIQSPEDSDSTHRVDESYYENKAVVIDTVADVFKEPDLSSERLTQVLFNQKVTILEDSEGWAKVEVVDGHIGWIRAKYIDENCKSIMDQLYDDRVVVTGKTKRVFTKPGEGATIKNVVMGTELYVLTIMGNYYKVALPWDMTGWVERKDTIVVPVKKSIKKTSEIDLVTTVNKFIGTSYLSGGISDWEGIDSTGLVYICTRINGIEILRKNLLDYDAVEGENIEIQNIKQGDLVFLNNGREFEKVFEIGIFIGEDQFIYADKSEGAVVSASTQSERFQNRLIGIKRIFN
ncbi:SH3 domain-containing protein [Herbivorax sp. ANBcel31]|uniref:C40 family peptidase n=1 Tax=Herbivorax sp. ANBcel31 TaxID=3069754 RepID=UPI0027B34E95|nr:SH3 domain-containing C40 family peptidase [Herbivorax sp. ANBcel31]MDQ2086052.1 SH3 domain-containing protein [Herbivorax sp. ANBcel31]